jgi:hypothetical protein
MAKQTITHQIVSLQDKIERILSLLNVLSRSILYNEDTYFHSDAVLIDHVIGELKLIDTNLTKIRKENFI